MRTTMIFFSCSIAGLCLGCFLAVALSALDRARNQRRVVARIRAELRRVDLARADRAARLARMTSLPRVGRVPRHRYDAN